MSQNNIGEFIQQSRKAKGFTQKDLGDRIGVSDKTISKWENGNSIPDTSILNELCATLDINVNELLSGEKLTPEIYSMKAEENMMNLLEDNQKQQRFALLPCAAGIILLILTGLFAIGILLLKEIVAIILGNQFRNAIDIFPFLLLYPVLYTLSETTGVGIGFKRKTSYSIVITSIAGITNIAFNWLLIPMFNGAGAAMATGISYIAFFWGRTLISRKLWYKFDLKIYVFSNIILLSNCAIHTFMKGYFPYVFSIITLLAIIIYFSVYIKKNDFIVKLRKGEIFE